MKLENLMNNKIFRFKFLFYLGIIAILYYSGTYYIATTDDSELTKWRVPNLSEVLDSVKLLLQALAAAMLAITIFFMGKFHDFRRSFAEKIGEFKEVIIIFEKMNKPKTKTLIDISKREDYFIKKLTHQYTDTGITIGFTLILLFVTALSFYDISTNDISGVKENFSTFLSICLIILIFFLQWYHLDYMISNRQGFFTELVFDLAKIRAFTSSK